MTVEIESQIDFISMDENSGTVILTVSDHLEWGENEHLNLLQEKINAYLRFIESGEIFESYPNANNKKFKIEVKMKHTPDLEAQKFLFKCTDSVLSAGIQFNYEVL